MNRSCPPYRVWIDRPAPGVDIPDDVELSDGPAGADAVIVGPVECWDGAACRRLPDLKVVARPGIGYENVDVAGCAGHGVAACNAPDAPTVSTAEHALALLLAVAKRLKPAERRLREAAGDLRGLSQRGALELDGRTLGLVGCGRIGSRVGRYAEALGMHVMTFDPHIDEAPVGAPVAFGELLAGADAVSLHAPATPETHHIIDERALAAMRPGVIVVNCARGSLVDQDALLAAVESGHVAGAGLDVTDPEPLPPDHPLLHRDDVIVTPHTASTTTVGHIRLISTALGQALTWLRGGTPEHLLDAAAAHPAVDRRRRPT